MDAKEKARIYFLEQGYSCSEVVWLALSDDLELQCSNMGLRLAGGFSGGVGCGSFCGALAGGVLVLGHHFGREQGQERNPTLRELSKNLCLWFSETYGSELCLDIKEPVDSKVKCCQFVVDTVEAVERMLREHILATDGC